MDDAIHIDCDTCDLAGVGCGDCVLSVLLGPPPALLEPEEQRALEVLAASGLVPPLRLVSTNVPPDAQLSAGANGGYPQRASRATG